MSSTSTSNARYLKTIGIVNNGYNGRGFANPYDVAVSEEGNLFVFEVFIPSEGMFHLWAFPKVTF